MMNSSIHPQGATAIAAANGLAGAATAAGGTAAAPARGRRVVDAPTRMFHALFAISFVGAYLSAEGDAWRGLHVMFGYTLLGLLVFRIGYGLMGPRAVRLSALAGRLAALPGWLRGLPSALRGGVATVQASGRQGSQLALLLSVAALLLLALPLVASGIAAYHEVGEAFIGDAFAELHEGLGEAMLFVVLAHVALVLGVSLARRRNLAAPMWSGRVAGAGPDLVRRNRGWLAALLLLAVLAWGAFEWQQSPKGLVRADAVAGIGAAQDDDAD